MVPLLVTAEAEASALRRIGHHRGGWSLRSTSDWASPRRLKPPLYVGLGITAEAKASALRRIGYHHGG